MSDLHRVLWRSLSLKSKFTFMTKTTRIVCLCILGAVGTLCSAQNGSAGGESKDSY